MSLSSTASSALALSQETSDNLFMGKNQSSLIVVKKVTEDFPQPQKLCFMKHESVLSEHFTAKAFLCRLAGHWSCLAGHVLWYLSTNSFLFDLSTTKQHRMSPDSKVLLWCSNLRNLTQFFFLQARKCIRQQVKTEFTTPDTLW